MDENERQTIKTQGQWIIQRRGGIRENERRDKDEKDKERKDMGK